MSQTTITCRYFPTLPARWRCFKCNINLAHACAKPLDSQLKRYDCPLCLTPLQSLGIGNSIPPFWERIPRFFSYPLQTDALAYIGALALLGALATLLEFFAFLLVLPAIYAILRYAYRCLEHTARGKLTPPKVFELHDESSPWLPLKQMLIFLAMGFCVAWVSHKETVLGIVTYLFVILSVPASVMLLAVNQSLLQAANPIAWVQVMLKIGNPYLVLYFFLLLLSGGGQYIQSLLIQFAPAILVSILFTFASGYFTVAMFSMMGYVIYQYHEQLGVAKVREFSQERELELESGISDDPFINEIAILIIEAMPQEACRRLQEKLQVSSDPVYRDKYHRLLVLIKAKQKLVVHGEVYLKQLLTDESSTKNIGLAVQVYADCLGADLDYYYPVGKSVYAMAVYAHRIGKANLAFLMLKHFSERFAQNPKIPDACFLAAKILAEQEQQDAKARKMLMSLLEQYPGHALTGEIQTYLRVLERLQDQPFNKR